MKKIITSIALIFASAVLASAQDNTVAMSFSRIPRDIASMGMAGNTVLGQTGTAMSAFSNMAAIPFSASKYQVAAGYQTWGDATYSTTNINAGGSVLLGKFGLTAAYSTDAGQEYNVVNASGTATNKSFTPKQTQIAFGASSKFNEHLAGGAGVRSIKYDVAEGTSYSAMGINAYLMAQVNDFQFAAGINDVGGQVQEGKYKYDLPTSIQIAAGYNGTFAEKHALKASLEADYYFCGGIRAAAGAQYSFNELAFLRAGYNFSKDGILPSFATVGAGIKFMGVKLDVAYILASDTLAGSLGAGLGFEF